jgi:hypothetical protein
MNWEQHVEAMKLRFAVLIVIATVVSFMGLVATFKLSGDHVKVVEIKAKLCAAKESCTTKFTLNN